MLSSFINRRKVKSKISLFDAALRRAPSSPPLEAQSDQESPRPKQWTSLYKSSIPSVAGLRISALRRQSSPKVFLDFTPSGANDWFPQEILAPHEEDDHLPIQPVPESSTSSTYDDVVVIGPQRVPHVSPTQIPSKPPPRPKPSPALPPLPADSSSSPSPIEPTHGATTPPMSRKPAPAPIKIPTHPSKVQIQRSASTGLKDTGALFPTATRELSNALQPGTAHPSAVSLNDDSSAISGTTLARALIANSFILSNDNPGRNRYRSGGNLPRQDSATLPGANETGLLISPYWRDRRISGGEIVHSPESGIDPHIPPVPPIPPSLSSALSHTRHQSTEVSLKPPSRSQSLQVDRLYNRVSKKPEPSSALANVTVGPSDPAPTQVPASSNDPRPALPQSPSDPSISSHDNSPSHSLNDTPSPPRNSSADLDATSSSDPVPANSRRSQLPPSLNLPSPSTATDGEDSSRPRPTLSDNQDEPQRTGASSNTTRTENTMGSATSGEDITNVLAAYRFVSPLKSSFPVHMHESPDPSTPSLSPWSGGSRSQRTDTTSSTSFPQTPDSATSKRSRNGLSVLDMRHVFTDSTGPGQRRSGTLRPGRLPIGNDRPRSVHAPSSPFSRRSGESRRSTDDTSPAASNTRSSSISSPDILDFMFIPSTPSLPSRPRPIKVIRKSLDSFEGTSDRSPTTAEALRQTFPETPQAFSPLFSAQITTPGAPPLPPSSVGTPGTPLSTTQARGKPRRGLSNPAITRAASLYARTTPSNSNRIRMSPIPSAPGTPESPEVHKVIEVRKDSEFEVQQFQAAANLLTTSLGASRNTSSPIPSSPRRNSDPTGNISRDPGTLPDQPEAILRSTPKVKTPETEPSEGTPLIRSTPTPLERSPDPSARSRSAAEGKGPLPTHDPQDKDGDNVSVSSEARLPIQGSTQPNDQVRRFGSKQRPRALDLPVANSCIKSMVNPGSATKRSDVSLETRQELGNDGLSSQTDATPETGTTPVVSADTTTPVATPARTSPAASVRSLSAPEQSSPRLNALQSPGPSSSHPLPNSSSHTTPNVSAISSPVPPSQRSPERSPSTLDHTPTTSTSQARNTSPALQSSTLISPTQHNRSSSLDVPSFSSFLRQSYGDLVVVNPPPPYQTAILSQVVSLNGKNEPPVGPSTLLPSYIHTPPNRQGDEPRPAEPAHLPQAQTHHSPANVASVSEGAVRERSDSVADTRIPRNRPLGPRNPSGSQGLSKVSSLGTHRSRQGSVSSIHPHSQRSGVKLGVPLTSRKISTGSCRGKPGPRFPTVPIKLRGHTLDVARWTFTSQELQDIASRAVKASAESYCVRLLRLETLDTELPEELHRLELLTMDLKTRLRGTAAAKRELLGILTAHTSGIEPLDHDDLEKVVEELGDVARLAEELNDELYAVVDQIAQLKRLRDVHSSSALAMSLRKLNTSFLRQATENQFLRERVAALEAERDIAWMQAEHVAQEFDEFSTKPEQGIGSAPSSASNSRRTSRIRAVRKSSLMASKSGLRQSMAGKTGPRTPKRLSSIGSIEKAPEDIPPVPSVPDIQDLGSAISQQSRHRPPLIQTMNLPDQVTPLGLYSEMTPTTETRAMAQAQRELCEMLGINLTDLKSRPRSMSGISRPTGLPVPGLVRCNSDVKPLTPTRHDLQHREYVLSSYDQDHILADLTLRD